jgi:hypothetical protein
MFCSVDTSYLVFKAVDNENLLHHTLNRRVKMMTSRMSLYHSALGADVMLNLSASQVFTGVTAFRYAWLCHWDSARCRMRQLQWQSMRQNACTGKLYSSHKHVNASLPNEWWMFTAMCRWSWWTDYSPMSRRWSLLGTWQMRMRSEWVAITHRESMRAVYFLTARNTLMFSVCV